MPLLVLVLLLLLLLLGLLLVYLFRLPLRLLLILFLLLLLAAPAVRVPLLSSSCRPAINSVCRLERRRLSRRPAVSSVQVATGRRGSRRVAFKTAALGASEGDTSNGGWADGQGASADDDATYYDATVERWRQWRAECRTPFVAKRSSP